MSFDPRTHTQTALTWRDGGILELVTRLGTNRAACWDGLVIEQGRRLNIPVAWSDERMGALDLSSGYTAQFQVRTQRDTGSALLSLTHSSGITLAAAAPNITIAITAAQSAALTFSRAWYELAVTHTASTTVQRLLHGACELSRRAAS